MNNGRHPILTPNQLAAAQQPVVQQFNVAQPINDVQLICLIAGNLSGTAAERVELAQNIFAEAVGNHDRLRQKMAELRAAKEPPSPPTVVDGP